MINDTTAVLAGITKPQPERPPAPPDGTMINGRATTEAEAPVIAAARAADRAAAARLLKGINRPKEEGS